MKVRKHVLFSLIIACAVVTFLVCRFGPTDASTHESAPLTQTENTSASAPLAIEPPAHTVPEEVVQSITAETPSTDSGLITFSPQIGGHVGVASLEETKKALAMNEEMKKLHGLSVQ